MPTLNVTSVQIVCSCSSIGNATDVENCTASEITCPKPNVVSNSVHITHGNRLYDNVTYTCHHQYKINGSSTNTKNATFVSDRNIHGIWINVPKCE
ncbi:hypothetical protein LSH36_573g07054, partial [Paralvinella palmiformis]